MLKEYIESHMEWSQATFGSGRHTEGLCKHIEKELQEIREAPLDLEEWVDVMILAIDGAWRAGYSTEQIIDGLQRKQRINANRLWPRVFSEYEPIEHIREV